MIAGEGNGSAPHHENADDAADIRVGDIVSWEGDDRHEVVSTNGTSDQLPTLIEIRCVQPSAGWLNEEATGHDEPWARIGDVNWLSADEVDLVRRPSLQK